MTLGKVETFALGYSEPDGNPDWLNAICIVGFVVVVVFVVAGYVYYRSKGARDS